MIRNRSMALVLMLAAAAAAPRAQERAAPMAATALKVQVVLSRYDGDRKLASMPYTLLVNAGERDNRVTLRMGVALPVTGVGANGPTVTVHDIGTNMDCTATRTDDGRFRIGLAVNHTSVYENDQKHGTLWVMVAKRYFVQIETQGIEAKELQDWVKRIDLKKLAEIK